MKLQLNQDKTKIVLKESTREEYNQLKRCLTPFVKGYRFTPRFKLTSWDGRFDYFNNGVMDFGLWSEIYSCCKEYGYPFEIINKEEFPRDNEINIEHLHTFCQDFYKDHKLKGEPFMPYDHQIEAAYKMLKHRFGLIEVATSGGKSLIFATMVFYYLKNINPNAKILLIVPSIMLVSQFYDDILDYNLGFEQENQSPLDIRITEIMSDKPRKVRDDKEPNIYIGTYQSLIKYGTPELQPYFFKQFDIVCCDECLHPDTLITMADDSKKKIKDVKIGDLVYVFNEKTKVKEIKEVEHVYKNLSKNKQMYEIEMENGEIIKITGNHKVLLTNGEWKKAEDLLENDDILDF